MMKNNKKDKNKKKKEGKIKSKKPEPQKLKLVFRIIRLQSLSLNGPIPKQSICYYVPYIPFCCSAQLLCEGTIK